VNTGFGTATHFAWGQGQDYSVRTSDSTIKVFDNFQEKHSFKTDFENEELFGGNLMGITGPDFISFYDWNSYNVVRRIDIEPPKNVYWSDSGLVILALEDCFHLLHYDKAIADAYIQGGAPIPEDGIESAFKYLGRFEE